MRTESKNYTTFKSPIGTLVIAGRAGKIQSLRVVTEDGRFAPQPSWNRADDEFAEASAQFAAYFAGKLRKFSLPLELVGTPFQMDAWRILRAVPYGTTTTYGEIARTMGRPNASRAVGGAMNRNPITIIVPCHRVVGKDGALTGYLNGTEMKHRLLAMESAN
jgi:methylated-DNA-[protein]-cysteine S-methyltransferase